METVQMLKGSLLAQVKENRDNHRAEFEKALKGFQITAIEVLEKNLELARKGQRQRVFVHLDVPEDHTKDYDRIIGMLQNEVRDTVELTQHEFAQYVQDDWGWKQQWTTSNVGYASRVV